MKIIIFLIRTILAVVLATVLSTTITLLILNRDGSLFSLNLDDNYPDLTISINDNTSEQEGSGGNNIGLDEIISFINTLPQDRFGEVEYTSILKTRANVNSGKTKSNLDVYAIEQESFANIISALANTVSGEYALIDSREFDVIVGSRLARSLGVSEGDRLIISMVGDKFMYYAEQFNVKFVTALENEAFDNAIIMSRNYIDSIMSITDDNSFVYLNMDDNSDVDEIKNILLEKYNDSIEVATRADSINGYDAYFDIFGMIPIIYALLFSSMMLFISMINLKSRNYVLSVLKHKLKNMSAMLLPLLVITESIVLLLFLVMTLPILQVFLNISNDSIYISYRMPIVLISIAAIIIITAISYLLCFLQGKKH